jgi:hypothetical protein
MTRIRIIKHELFLGKYGRFEGSLCRWPEIQVLPF